MLYLKVPRATMQLIMYKIQKERQLWLFKTYTWLGYLVPNWSQQTMLQL